MIDPLEMPLVADLRVPQQLWWARTSPVPLAAMQYPQPPFGWSSLASAGFTDVVDLTMDHSSYDAAPLRVTSVRLEDLWGGRDPADAGAELATVERAVTQVIDNLAAGRGTVVHCHGGTGRSGTVIGGALVRLGEDPAEVAAWLDGVHRLRGRSDGWPESPWQRAVLDEMGVSG